ncbi:unnamed protein product, partial [Rotaria sordida]
MKQSIKHSSTIPLKVNRYDFTFELDTETFNTIISMEDWLKFGLPTIRPSTLELKCYSGNTLKIKDECNVEKFTKLDLSDTYLQVELDEQTKNLVIINIPLGLFRYNRMQFVIVGVPNCVSYRDDILLTGANEEEHSRTLEMVFLKRSEFGFRCNPEKYLFFQGEVSYLGGIINKNGKRPDPKRVEAIINMPAPKNVKELEAFI